MNALYSIIESAGILMLGLAARFALLLIVLAVLAVPAMLMLVGVRGFGAIRRRLLGVVNVDGMLWRRDLFYAPGHLWLRRDERGGLRVGFDDLAQRLFPGPTRIKLPKPGTRVHKGEAIGEIASGGKHAALVAPVDGRVIRVNQDVADDGSPVHRDPYEKGWLFNIEPTTSSYERLPTGDRARSWFIAESQRLSRFLELELATAAADGGEFILPAPSLLSDDQWRALTRAFLGA